MRQFGTYLPWALVKCGGLLLVREERSGLISGVRVVIPMALLVS